MARKQTYTALYFPHFVDSGKTIFKLEKAYGDTGYAFFFKLLEMLGKEENHYLNLDSPADMDYFAAKVNLTPEQCEKLISDMVTWGKIDRDLWEQNRVIWYQKFVDNLATMYKNRKRELPEKPGINIRNKITTVEMQVQSDSYSRNDSQTPISTVESTQSKVKESKVNKSKEEESKTASTEAPPPEEILEELASENLPDETAKEKKASHTGGAGPPGIIELIFPFDTPNFRNKWQLWNDHRKSIKKPYKNILSEQAALKSLSEFEEDYAISLIERSIAAGYQGLVFGQDTRNDYQKYLKSKNHAGNIQTNGNRLDVEEAVEYARMLASE